MKERRKINRIKYFTEEEISRLFSVITKPRDLLIFRLAYHHGLRASEVGMLRISDVDLKSGRIVIDRLKGSIGSSQTIHPVDLELLREYLVSRDRIVEGDILFVSREHKPVGRNLLHTLMKHYGKLAKLPRDKCHFHALKHSIATHLLSHGAGIEFVQEFLGHVNINNTLVYARLTAGYFDKETRTLWESMK